VAVGGVDGVAITPSVDCVTDPVGTEDAEHADNTSVLMTSIRAIRDFLLSKPIFPQFHFAHKK